MHSTSRSAVAPLLRRALSKSTFLSAERERELLVRFHADGNKAAMDELVRSHMPIIFRVAGRSAQNPGVDINDLIQTATEGLLVAINRWSFEKSDASGSSYATEVAREAKETSISAGADAAELGEPETSPPDATPPVVHSTRLATYAVWWMRIMLTNSVIESRGVVVRAKSPKVRKALFSLPGALKKLEISMPLSGNDVTRIASALGIDEQYIEEALVHASGDVLLDEPIGDGNMVRGDGFVDERAEGETGILNRLASADSWDAICEALMDMSPRDRFILITRYLLVPKWKLSRLSDTLEMSRERIRQIGCDGLARIRSRVGTSGSRHDPSRRPVAEELNALVAQIERASESADPGAIAELMKSQRIAIGSTRSPAARASVERVSIALPASLQPRLALAAPALLVFDGSQSNCRRAPRVASAPHEYVVDRRKSLVMA